MKTLLFFVIAISLACNSFALEERDMQEIKYHLDIAAEVSDRVGDIFEKFRDGYMDADEAFKKVHNLRLEYDKMIMPVPEEARTLYGLMRILLSRIQNYFIYFKRADRENPEINLKIAETRYRLALEVYKLQLVYDHSL